jgi:parvulin-like peptidyl-prolyl isomerase
MNKDTNFIAEFKDAALALQNVGDTTGLVQSSYGYHIIKLVDKIQEGPTPFEKVEKILKDVTVAPEIQKIISEYVAEQKKGMKIERFENRL